MSTAAPDPLAPIEPPAMLSATAAPTRAFYCLKVHGHGFVAALYGRHSFLYTPDLDRAHRWTLLAEVEEWIRELPEGHLARLRGKQLFVALARVVPERIVQAWTVNEATPAEAAGAK